MGEWKEINIGNDATLSYGKMPNKDLLGQGNYPTFSGYKYQYLYPESNCKKGDLIVVARGVGGTGDVKIIKEDAYLTNLSIKIDFNPAIVDNQFFYYYFHKETLRYLDSGSAQSQITITDLESESFLFPELPEQKAIASVLSSLDDKIDLLHRQNKTLEAMAETLFRQWFVEEAREDWEEGVLSDEFDFTMGQSPPGDSYNEEGIGIALFQGNADFGFRFPTNRVYTTDPKRFAEKYDTLISVRAPVGAQNMAKAECCIGRGVATFRYKNNNNFYTYTYFKLRSLMDEIRKFNDEGTVFGSIGKTDFQQIKTLLPSRDLIEKFENEAKPLNDKVIENCNQIKLLEATRDTLLSRLMSGKIRVQYDKELVV